METLWLAERTKLKDYLETRASISVEQMEARSFNFTEQTAADIMTTDGDVGIIKIVGFLQPNGPDWIDALFGIESTGFAQIREAADILKADDQIKTVRLVMNTPGGTVTGTDETFKSLLDLAGTKELIAENHGLIASAGYWLAVAADRIIAMSPTVETGSIGVIVAGFDWTEAFENMGAKRVVIVSKNAPKKASDITTKDGIAELQRRINAIERVFTAAVSFGRKVDLSVVLKDFGQGGVLIADDPDVNEPDAIKVKMIDQVISANRSVNNRQMKISETKTTDSGGDAMLEELLNANPGAKTQHEAALQKNYALGKAENEKLVSERVTKAKPFLASTYPEAIQKLAIQVITGEVDHSALAGAAAAFDSLSEAAKSKAAEEETKNKGETPPNAADAISTDGILANEQQLQAEASRLSGATEKVA